MSSSSAPGRPASPPPSMPASEGLSVLALDCRSFGGQAGASARIENYLGFPTGISGMALMGRAFSQAQKFGVEIAIPDEAVKLECGNDPCHVQLATGERIQARAVVLATGARYRRLGVEQLEDFEGSSVHYWASPLEADLCAGAGGRAGRRRQFGGPGDGVPRRPRRTRDPDRAAPARATPCRISGRADRGPAPMSRSSSACEIAQLEGAERALEAVTLARPRLRAPRRAARSRYLFSFIGAEPNTDWLAGFGPQARRARLRPDRRTRSGDERLPLETSRPRRVRGRRRPRLLGQAGCRRGRRRRPGRRRDPRLSRRSAARHGTARPVIQPVVATA